MTNRVKDIDLVDRVSEELWTEVQKTVQKAVTKTIQKKKKCKKAKRLPVKALQISENRREEKGKGKRKRWAQLNAEFQRTARRDKKAFLSEQCKEIEENNRNGNARDIFKKTGDTWRTFHAMMGTIRDRNGKDLTETEEIKKRQQENTEKLYNNCLNDLENLGGLVTHLKPDILKCEVKWALGRITINKVSEGDEIPAELFQIL